MNALQLHHENYQALESGGRPYLWHVPSSGLFAMDADLDRILGLLREGCDSEAALVERGVAPATAASVLETLTSLEIVSRDGTRARALPRLDGLPLTTLVLNVTSGCNLACSYCYQGMPTRDPVGEQLAVSTGQRAIDLFLAQASGQQQVNLVFFGGEPLTAIGTIRALVAYAERACAALGIRPEFSLTTNATLLTPTIIHFLQTHRFGITVSIDGPRDVHDRHRKLRSGAGSYTQVARRVSALLGSYDAKPVGARVTVTAGDTDVVAIHRHLRGELGFTEVGFSPASADECSGLALDADGMERLYEGLRELAGGYVAAAVRGENFGFTNLHQLLTTIAQGAARPLPCGAGLGMLAVSTGGELHLCHRFVDQPGLACGSVEAGIDEPRRQGFLQAALQRVAADADCRHCTLRNLCAGGCYHEAQARYGDPLRPNHHVCALMRDWIVTGLEAYLRIKAERPAFLARLTASQRRWP